MHNTVKTHLQKLVSFASVSAESNRDIAEYCIRVLQHNGFLCHTIPDPDQDKINVLAVAGNMAQAGIVFSAHTDVVPTTGQDWTYPPFTLTDMGDKWYGRGTTDMKGYIALLLAYANRLVTAAEKSGLPVYICLSYDEEVGCRGVPYAIEKFPELVPTKPKFCFVGEPTEMKPILGHKGKMAVRVSVAGKACHSATCTDGINAIEIASHIVIYIEKRMRDCVQNGIHDPLSHPPHATLQTGLIQGGNALNIVPDTCTFCFEIRSSYQQQIHDIYTDISKYIQDVQNLYHTRITCTEIGAYPPLSTEANSPIKRLADALCGHVNPTPAAKVSFGTEGGLFAAYGIPTLVLGMGSMAQGHKADEYIAVSQIRQGIQFFENITQWIHTQEIPL